MEKLSDHASVNVEMTISTYKHNPLFKTILNYTKANVDAICTNLVSFSTSYLEDFAFRSTNENWNLLKFKLLQLADLFIPKVNIPSSVEKPWFSARLKKTSQ